MYLMRLSHSVVFVALLVTQWADLIICKTRRLSIIQHGMGNWAVNIALVVQTAVACIAIYVPGIQTVLESESVPWYFWFCGLPFAIIIIVVDEARRYVIRKYPNGWVFKETYY